MADPAKITSIFTDAMLNAILEYEDGQPLENVITNCVQVFSAVAYGTLVAHAESVYPGITKEAWDETMDGCLNHAESIAIEFLRGTKPIAQTILSHIAENN